MAVVRITMPPQSDQLIHIGSGSFADDVCPEVCTLDRKAGTDSLVESSKQSRLVKSNNPLLLSTNTCSLCSGDCSLVPKVHFAPEEDLFQTYEVLRKADYTQQEQEAVWLTRSDLMRIEEDIRSDMMLASMRTRRRPIYEVDPARGLEWRTLQGSKQRLKYHQKGTFAVFAEQRRLKVSRKKGPVDLDQLAYMYRNVSTHCQRIAEATAAQDERGVKEDPGYETFKASIENKTFSSNSQTKVIL